MATLDLSDLRSQNEPLDLSDLRTNKIPNQTSIPQEMLNTFIKRFGQTQDIPTAGIFAGLQGVGSVGQRIKNALPPSGEISGILAQKGLPPSAATGLGALFGLGKSVIPTSDIEAGLQVVGGPLTEEAIASYGKRVVPTLTEFFFPSVGKVGAEALAANPREVARIANLGPEGAAREETAAMNKVRAGAIRVLQDARNKFGQLKTSILGQSGNPEVDANPIQQATAKTLSNYNFIPELKTGLAADPKFSSVAKSVSGDIEEFATRPGGVIISDLMRLREGINKLLRSNITPTAKGALGQIKESVDSQINAGLGNELSALYGKANRDFGQVAQGFEDISSLVSRKSKAPKVVAELEGTAQAPGPTELGQKLKDFLGNAASVDNLSNVVGARRFTGNIFRNLRGGSSMALAGSIPAQAPTILPGAGIAGQLGIPTSPLGLANFASGTSKALPVISRAGAIANPILLNFLNKNKK